MIQPPNELKSLSDSYSAFVESMYSKQSRQAVSTALQQVASHNLAPSANALHKIQNLWVKIWQEVELATTPTETLKTLHEKFKKNLTILSGAQPEANGQPPDGQPQSVTVHPAEVIFPLIKDEETFEALRESLAPQAERLFARSNEQDSEVVHTREDPFAPCPESLVKAVDMLIRIMKGKYGQKVKAVILDTLTSPLLQANGLLRMLFIDLALQPEPSFDQIEWFTECDQEEMKRAASSIKALLDQLQGDTLVPRSLLCQRLLRDALRLPDALSSQISNIISKAYLPNARFLAITDVLRPYWSPSNEQITNIAMYTAQKDPKRAFEIACLIQEPEEERAKAISKALAAIATTTPETALELLATLKEREAPTYKRSVLLIAVSLAFLNSVESWNQAKTVALSIEDDELRFATVIEFSHIDHSKVEDPELRSKLWEAKRGAMLELLGTVKQCEDVDKCLDTYLAYEMKDRFDSLVTAIASCKELVNIFTDKVMQNLALSSIAYHCYNRFPVIQQPQFVELFYEIEPPTVRRYTLQRMVESFFGTSELTVEEVIEEMQRLIDNLKNEEEKDFVLRRLVSFAAPQNPDKAEALLKQIVDPYTRAFAPYLDKPRFIFPPPIALFMHRLQELTPRQPPPPAGP